MAATCQSSAYRGLNGSAGLSDCHLFQPSDSDIHDIPYKRLTFWNSLSGDTETGHYFKRPIETLHMSRQWSRRHFYSYTPFTFFIKLHFDWPIFKRLSQCKKKEQSYSLYLKGVAQQRCEMVRARNWSQNRSLAPINLLITAILVT